MSLLFFIILMMVVGVFYVRRKARRMFANLNEQMDPYRETFDKATKKTKVDRKQVFDGQFEEVRTTKEP